MDALVIGFVALQAIALAVALGVVLSRGRTLERLRDLLDIDRPGDTRDIETRARRLRDRAETAEREAAQTAADASYLGDLIGVGIVRIGDDGTVAYANAAAHVLLGRPADAMVGRPAVEAFADPVVDGFAGSARTSGSASGELVVGGGAGRTIAVRARRSPVRGIWLVLEDLSELRRLQQIRAEFIDNLSHELRTPVTTIGLLAETLARDLEAPGEVGEGPLGRVRERIARLGLETDRLTQTVTEMLDLARIEAGGPSLVLLDDVDLAAVAASAVERLRLFAERSGVRLHLELPDQGIVPPIRGDDERLERAVVNLVHNGIKFSPGGGDVTVSVRVHEGLVAIAVEDHGIGIPAEVRGRIFERFYKVDRARPRGAGGTGLGLAIARHIVESHGGRIRVESEEGSGSTFFVELPVAVDPPGRVAAANHPPTD